MDERRLAALFREAASSPPPASFGRDDVVAASRRATVRRRAKAVVGLLGGVAVLVGVLLTGAEGLPGRTSPAAAPAVPEAEIQAGNPAAPHILGSPPGAQDPTTATGGPDACGPVDPALAAALTAVLTDRGIAAIGPAQQAPGPCPAGSSAAGLRVGAGTLYAVLVPTAGQSESVSVLRPDGGREHARTLGDGRGLVVISMPPPWGGTAPLADELPELAARLADRL